MHRRLPGEILAAIHMEKRLTTAEGKTWAGRVIEPTGASLSADREFGAPARLDRRCRDRIVQGSRGQTVVQRMESALPAWVYGAANRWLQFAGAAASPELRDHHHR